MKKALLIVSVLFVAVISTACINNIAVQELNNKAAEYMEKGDYEAAMNRLQASLDLDSSMYETYYNLGVAAIEAKKYEKAIEALEAGIKIKSDFNDFYYSLAVAQNNYADELATKKSEEDKEEVATSNESKEKSKEFKQAALDNLKKYQEMSPNSDDKETVAELIKEIEQELLGDDAKKEALD